MEIKEIFREDAIIMKREEFKNEMEKGCMFGHYWSIDIVEKSDIKKSRLSEVVRELKDEELCIIGKYRVNGRPRYNVDWLIDRILRYFNTDRRRVFNKKRGMKVIYVRQVVQAVLWLCSENDIIDKMSCREIGFKTGRFKGETVLNSLKRVGCYYQTEKKFKERMDRLFGYLKLRGYIEDDLQRV